MRNLMVLSVLGLASTWCLATTFQPISIKKQILESTGIVEGEVVEITPELDQNGKIVTKVTLRPDKWMGDVQYVDEHSEVYFPGGQIADQARYIEGVPNFNLGEKVVLFVRSDEYRSWVSNLGLGKYSIKRMGNESIMVNQIFPTEPNMGKIGLDEFHALAQEVKGEKFSYRFKEKYELYSEKDQIQEKLKNKTQSRSIASIDQEKEENTSIDPLWLVFLLGGLGVMFGVIRNRTS